MLALLSLHPKQAFWHPGDALRPSPLVFSNITAVTFCRRVNSYLSWPQFPLLFIIFTSCFWLSSSQPFFYLGPLLVRIGLACGNAVFIVWGYCGLSYSARDHTDTCCPSVFGLNFRCFLLSFSRVSTQTSTSAPFGSGFNWPVGTPYVNAQTARTVVGHLRR